MCAARTILQHSNKKFKQRLQYEEQIATINEMVSKNTEISTDHSYMQSKKGDHSKYSGWNVLVRNVNRKIYLSHIEQVLKMREEFENRLEMYPEDIDEEEDDVLDDDKNLAATLPTQETMQVKPKKGYVWKPSKKPPPRSTMITSIIFLVFVFILTILGFFIIIGGYDYFCITSLESPRFKRWFRVNGTCPNSTWINLNYI